MNSIKKHIWQLTEKAIENTDFLLIDLVTRGTVNNPVFEIFIDNSKGITTEDCVQISRKLHELIEGTEIGKTKYRLDVSSPGIDRPLKYIEQYPKNINREFELEYLKDDETKKTKATLVAVRGNELEFKNEKELIIIDINRIKKAKVIISF